MAGRFQDLSECFKVSRKANYIHQMILVLIRVHDAKASPRILGAAAARALIDEIIQ
jgi:hypothetical protein